MFLVALILITHFVGDFLLQSDWMAINKSKSAHALIAHAAAYGLTLLVGMSFWMMWTFSKLEPDSLIAIRPMATALMIRWVGINTLLHGATDFVTSRLTAKLWFFKPYGESNMWRYAGGSRHWFFCMIGFDQLVHTLTLFGTLYWSLT